MSYVKQSTKNAVILCSFLLVPYAARAVPTDVAFQNRDTCDTLAGPPQVDELGVGAAFPVDERIAADASLTERVACKASDSPDASNSLVTIINRSGRAFTELWYVADPETSLSNVDGLVNGELAFKIDTEGSNRPLISESINADGIFEVGETWKFIIVTRDRPIQSKTTWIT